MELSQRQIQASRKSLEVAGNAPHSSTRSLGSSDGVTSGRSLQLTEANVESGMVLPFEPVIMTFKDVHYYVPLPPVSFSWNRAWKLARAAQHDVV